jgi:hypothetical protein
MATRIRSEHRSGFTELEIETVNKDDTVKIIRRIRRYQTTEIDITVKSFVKEDCNDEKKSCSLLTKNWFKVISIIIELFSLFLAIYVFYNT